MISFQDIDNSEPYLKFKDEYDKAVAKNQNIIEAICISSYSLENKIVDSRFVNLKTVNNKEFIFFSNYTSPKAIQFETHNQISAVIFWAETNVQIRMKAKIKKLSIYENKKYFESRSKEKNALAISSMQSKKIDSYDQVKINYQDAYENQDLSLCPQYWGGFSFEPYYFEFWEGNKNRLNKREVFEKLENHWDKYILQP
tara:strand:- start:659 stop:1255 length:597 start_codon:yes stop_codon:yes gene_type:complete